MATHFEQSRAHQVLQKLVDRGRKRRDKERQIAAWIDHNLTFAPYKEYVYDCGDLGLLYITFHMGGDYHTRWHNRLDILPDPTKEDTDG